MKTIIVLLLVITVVQSVYAQENGDQSVDFNNNKATWEKVYKKQLPCFTVKSPQAGSTMFSPFNFTGTCTKKSFVLAEVFFQHDYKWSGEPWGTSKVSIGKYAMYDGNNSGTWSLPKLHYDFKKGKHESSVKNLKIIVETYGFVMELSTGGLNSSVKCNYEYSFSEGINAALVKTKIADSLSKKIDIKQKPYKKPVN